MTVEAVVPELAVADVERSIAFYATALGFQPAQTGEAGGRPRWALLQCGPARLMVAASGSPGGAGARLHVQVADVRACRAALQASGIPAGEIRLTPHGTEAFLIRDPDGHEISVGSPALRIA